MIKKLLSSLTLILIVGGGFNLYTDSSVAHATVFNCMYCGEQREMVAGGNNGSQECEESPNGKHKWRPN